jgi:hypothetical protein
MKSYRESLHVGSIGQEKGAERLFASVRLKYLYTEQHQHDYTIVCGGGVDIIYRYPSHQLEIEALYL